MALIKEQEYLLKVVTYDKDTPIHACGCQQSKNKPMCDGTHKTIE